MAIDIIVQLDKQTAELNGDRPNCEHCSVDATTLRAFPAGRQVLIRRDNDTFALFTIVEKANNSRSVGVIRIGTLGRARLGQEVNAGCLGTIFRATIADFGATLTPNFLTTPTKTRRDFENALIESSAGTGTSIVILAPHGGDIEQHTDTQALRMYDELQIAGKSVRRWICQGWKEGGGAYDAWHITSTDISVDSFPKLAGISQTKFEHAVAFHGWTRPYIGVGGGADPTFRQHVCDVIKTAVPSVDVRLEDDIHAGSSSRNIVNALTARGNGLQIEQPKNHRDEYHAQIASAVAGIYKTL